MMGRQGGDQSQLFYLFNLERRIPADHLLRRINPEVTRVVADLHEKLAPFYSDIGRPSIDPELMIRMLIVGYCYGIRSERRLCEEVELHLAYRWFCRLDLDDQVPDHSTFSVSRHGRFRDSDILRHVFEAVVRACMDAGLIKGEGFAVDASVIEADASCYHGRAPDEIDWSAPERQTRAVAEFLSALDDDDADADRPYTPAWLTAPRPSSLLCESDALISSARTRRSTVGRGSAAPPITWLLGKNITPHIPVWERYERTDGMFPRAAFTYDAECNVYICPNGHPLRISGTIHDGRVRNYLSQPGDCK